MTPMPQESATDRKFISYDKGELIEMKKGIVIGNVVSTRKQESLVGSKFMEVRMIENGRETEDYVIAVDSVGAGIGETVLLTVGSSARLALANQNAPVDAVIVGIVD